MIETQNTSQAKFLVRELLAILKIMREEEFDTELEQLLEKITFKFSLKEKEKSK
jgi:hypothetical protein